MKPTLLERTQEAKLALQFERDFIWEGIYATCEEWQVSAIQEFVADQVSKANANGDIQSYD